MKNIYYEKLQRELQHYVDDFIRLRTATITELQLAFDTLKNPRNSMERTLNQAVERAYSLREQMLDKGRQLLDAEKDKLSVETDISVVEELRKLNRFYDFQNRLAYMSMNEIQQYANDDTLNESAVHQIKAELAHRKTNLRSEEDTGEIDNLMQSVQYISPLDRLDEAFNALEQIKVDKNVYPFLPAHLAMDNNIPRLLGSDMLSGLNDALFNSEES